MPSRGAHNDRGPRDDRKRNSKAPRSREETISRALSYLLRHNAASEGIVLDDLGFANVADVVSRECFSLRGCEMRF